MTAEIAPRTVGTLGGLPSGVMSFLGRHPVGSYLVLVFAIFWASWMPVLFFAAPPRHRGDLGLGAAGLPHHCRHGRPSRGSLICCVARRGGESASAGTCTRFRSARCSSPPCSSARRRSKELLQNWILLFTEFVPQLLLALMTVQFFEELGCAGFVQHRLQSRHGALNASFLVALAFAFLHLHLPECADLRSRRPPGLVGDGDRDSVRNLFPDPHHLRLQPHPVQRPHRLHHPRLLQRSV
jgi:hypothetical protein